MPSSNWLWIASSLSFSWSLVYSVCLSSLRLVYFFKAFCAGARDSGTDSLAVGVWTGEGVFLLDGTSRRGVLLLTGI